MMTTSVAGRACVLTVAMAGLAGCASTPDGGAATRSTAAGDMADSMEKADPPVIQIREFPGSAHVTIVAWSPEASNYGLRSDVNRRDGTLAGNWRMGDHQLYVSSAHVQDHGGFTRAWVRPVPPGPVLRHGVARPDRQACQGGEGCAPMHVVNVQMPDDLLRQHGDSMVMTFTGGRDRDWKIRLDGELIQAYLRAVDSVSAAVRAPQVGAAR